MTHPLHFSFAVNRYGTDKQWDYKLLAGKFEDCQGTIAEVQHHIRCGHALCAGLLNGQWRSKANVIGSQWVLLDIDNSKGMTDADGNPLDEQGRPIRIGRQTVDSYGKPISHSDGRKQGKVYDHQMTLEEAIAHPFIRAHAALIYTSASHQPNWHKFRLVFLLPQFVEGSDTIEALVRYLMEQLPHDPACKDASRVFYGNTRAEFPLINESAVLPTEWIEQAKIAAVQERIEQEHRLAAALNRRAQLQEVADRQGWNFDALVEEALSYIPPRQVGSGNYDECRQVLMALHSQYGSGAEVIAERWSPSIRGTTWNIAQKLKSFRRSDGVGIGTLFHIARQYGFKFPNSQPIEKTTDTLYLEWLNEQFRIDTVQDKLRSDQDFISNVFRYFGGGKKRKKTRKRVLIESSTKLIDLGTYSAGLLPQFTQSGSAYKIWYQPGTEAQLYQEAIAQGYQILDISPTGSGKTQRAGQLQPSNFTFDQAGETVVPTLIYLGSDHRNPKTASVESNFVDVPNRHNGMVIDSNRKTAMGKPYIVNPKAEHGDRFERLPGNCHKAHEFAIAQHKGLTWADETATANPICQSCVHFITCGDPTADHPRGSGFRALRSESLKASRIRMSPDQYPHNWESEKTINIWDEACQTIGVSDTLTVSLPDFDGAWATLEQEEPNLHQRLAPIRQTLRRLMTGPQPRYGYSRDQIMAVLKFDKHILDINEIERIRSVSTLNLWNLFGCINQIDTTEIVQTINDLKSRIENRSIKLKDFETEALRLRQQLASGVGILFGGIDEQAVKVQLHSLISHLKVLKDEIKRLNQDLNDLEDNYQAIKAANRRMQNINHPHQPEELANTFSRWLAPFLEVVTDTITGTLSIQHGKLLIHRLKNQHRRIIHEARANIFLDATASVDGLSFRTGIAAEKILVCEAIHDQGANVHHIQVKDFGLAGKHRAQSTDKRINAAIEGIRSTHLGCNPVTFDYLQKSTVTDAKGVHFRDSRGENTFRNNDVFIHVGVPLPNMGTVRIDHEILSLNAPTTPTFEAYYQEVCDAELMQELGRDRALRRKGDIFHYWLTDLELPFAVQTRSAAALSANAASQADITKAAITKAITILAKSGDKLTQQAIAQAAEVTQGWVSKFFASMGGWKVWRKIITSLLNASYRGSNNPGPVLESLSDDERWVAQEYLALLVAEFESDPVAVVESVAVIALGYGKTAWERILREVDEVILAQLIGLGISLEPQFYVNNVLSLTG